MSGVPAPHGRTAGCLTPSEVVTSYEGRSYSQASMTFIPAFHHTSPLMGSDMNNWTLT